MTGALKSWFNRHRQSSRMAFLLSIVARVINSVMALVWTRWLLGAMGAELYGLFISFQALVSLGTVGDLGLGGSVAIEANRMIGARRFDDLRSFLAATRTVFLILGLAVGAAFALSAPCLAPALGFTAKLGDAALPLFAIGAVTIAASILTNFTTALSNACGNLTWPIIPNLIALQAALATHLCLARLHAALWVQFIPYAVLSLIVMMLPWILTKTSNPEFAGVGLVRVGWKMTKRLLTQSFWVYLWTFGFLVYTATDRIVINRFFGPAQTSRYYLNYKPCELAVFTLAGLTYFSLTKIIQWHSSPDASDREKAVKGALRLQTVQVFLALAVALTYLALNNAFIYIWLGPHNDVSLMLQGLFAANLAITISSEGGTRLAGQINERGTVFAGIMVATGGVINLLLSILSAQAGFILGIAGATVVAQLFFGVTTGCFTARQLGLSQTVWVLRTTALPAAVMVLGFLLRIYLKPETLTAGVFLAGGFILLLIVVAYCLGIDRKMVSEEWQILRSMVRW